MLAEPQEHEFLQNLQLGEPSSEVSTSTTQAVVGLSSAEAEFYTAVKAAAAGIGCVSMMRDLGVVLQQQGVEVKAKGSVDEIGSPSLEIKLDACNAKRCWTHQTHSNPDAMVAAHRDQWRHQNDASADLGTKVLDYQTMNKHLKFCGMRFAEGRSQIAPQQEFFSTLIPMSDETSGSPHSATSLHEQRLELATGKCGMVTLAGRSELQLALDSDVARRSE